MKITKFFMNNIEETMFYSYPENTDSENKAFKIGFSVSSLAEKIPFGRDDVSSSHMLLEGWGEFSKDGSAIRTVRAGEAFFCEEKERIEFSGDGRLFNMFMAGGVRGFVRKMSIEKEKRMRVGEAMAASVVALLGLDAGFELEWDGKKLECEPGSAIIVEVNKQEFLNLKLFPEKTDMSIACATGVLLKNHDFGKFIGVHFLERGEGTCKARLDIRPEHMNPIGTVHGGCLFTLADAVCGIAASSMGGICTTVNSNIQFLNAAFGPKYLIAEAKPKKLGRKIRSFLIEIRDDRDVLICTVDMVFYSLQN